jgi:peptidoglycan/LPS O-acetylase OafA/YrhL
VAIDLDTRPIDGSRNVSRPISITKLPGFFVGTAALIALTGLVWRHVAGQAAFGADGTLNLLFDKWHLGPLRIVNFLALLLLTLRFGPLVSRAFRFRSLEVLGAASLPVFCVHLGVVLLALAAVGDNQGSTSLWLDLALLASTFCLLYATAWLFGTNTSRPVGMTASPVKQNAVSARAVR